MLRRFAFLLVFRRAIVYALGITNARRPVRFTTVIVPSATRNRMKLCWLKIRIVYAPGPVTARTIAL